MWDYVITAWEGIVDDDNKAIICDCENKTMLMGGSITFSSFISKCLEKLSESNEIHKEDLEKN